MIPRFGYPRLAGALAASLAGCVDVGIPSLETVFPTGNPFVVSGTAEVIDQDGPCLVWNGNNGIRYHLFQDPTLPNDEFDRVTTPGVTSRLQLAVRGDLMVDCRVGPTADVQAVLEIVE